MTTKDNKEKIYLAIIEWGTYLALFTPLIFFRQFFFPFVVPKTIFFRLVVDVMMIAYVFLVLSNRRYLPRMNALTASIIIFLAITVITSLTGINPEKSFWSVFERMTGLLTFFHLFAFYIMLIGVFKERKQWERFLTVSILFGVFLCFYVWTAEETFARGGGTVGNTSFLAGYLLFDIFFAIILFFTKNGGWKIFYGILLLILVLGLFVSKEPCRGAIAAFFGGLGILLFGYIFFRLLNSGKKSLKILAYLIPVILVAGVVIAFQFDYVEKKATDFLQTGASVGSRMIVWKIAFEGWKERFWLGWGQENFNVPFAKYFDSALPLTVDVWYDRVHNIVLDVAVTSGILGLISYLAVFAVAIFGLMRLFSKVADRKNVFFPLGLIAVLMAYFAQNIWVFDMISSYMMFFFSLAFINFLMLSAKEENRVPNHAKGDLAFSSVGALMIILSVLSIYFGNIQPARASNMAVRGISLPLSDSVADFEKAYQLSPVAKTEIPEQFSRRIINLAGQAGQNPSAKDREMINKGFSLAEKYTKESMEKNPLDFRFPLFLGEYYRNLYQLTQNKDLIDLSQKTLEKAMELSPRNQQVYWSLGQTMLYQQKNDEAIEYFKKASELEPRLSQSRWYLFLVYKSLGKNDQALEELKKADELGYEWKSSADTLKQVAEFYKNIGDFNSLMSTLQEGYKLFPEDAAIIGNLADIYAGIGQKEKAKELAEKLIKLMPEQKSQIEQFIKDLGI